MTVKFGIIGLGNIANRFASVLVQAKDVSLAAVASRDMGRSRDFAEKYRAAKYYDSYDALIEDKDVNIIYIGLTHNFHYDIVRKCLEKGKAVLCEKPLVITEKEAAGLVELSRSKKVLLMEAMWTRCLPTFQKAKAWVKSGRIGTISLINASFSFNIPFLPEHRLYDPALAGGSLYDAGVYPIEFAIGIMDEIPSETKGVAHICSTGVDDFYSIAMGFESGALASLTCGFKANTNRDAVIYGTEGHVVVYNFLGSPKCECFDKEGKLVESFEADFNDGFIYEIEHAAQLFREDKTESPLIPHRDTLACARIFDILKKS